MGPEHRLATYGTLAPGKANHHQLDGLSGTWSPATVRGRMDRCTRGPHKGLPGLVLDPAGEEVPLMVFTSPDLPDHWARLDAFETEAFPRVVARIRTEAGEVEAFIYPLAP